MSRHRLKGLDQKWLEQASVEALEARRLEFDEQLRQIRHYKLQIQQEIERRTAPPEPSEAQVVTPEHLEADTQINGEPVKRRFWSWGQR